MKLPVRACKLQHQLCMLAATCLSTFDVCSEQEGRSLVSDEDFLSSCNTPSLSMTIYPHHCQMKTRRILLGCLIAVVGYFTTWSTISADIFHLPPARLDLSHAGAYDDAFSRLRPSHRRGKRALPRPNSRWIYCVTGEGQEVYYDLLTVELIIGGKRLEKLPQKITKHPLTAVYSAR